MLPTTPKPRLGVFFCPHCPLPIAHRPSPIALRRSTPAFKATARRIEGAEGLIAADDILYYLRPAVATMYRLTRNEGRRGLIPRAKEMRSLFLASAAQRLAIASALTAAIWAAYFLGKA